MMIRYQLIDELHESDVLLKNDPFPLYGKFIPSLSNGVWSYTVELFSEDRISSMVFPDEYYDFGILSQEGAVIGAYDGEKIVGLSVLKNDFFRYMLIDDLKVSENYRRQGIGAGLVKASMELAKSRGYRGVYAVAQDNNLAACCFYLKNGFEIGGFDNRSYRGTNQEEKANIFFYLD